MLQDLLVSAVNGAITALNESSSPPDQTPITLTEPPWTAPVGFGLLAPGAQAPATRAATAAMTGIRVKRISRIFNSPKPMWVDGNPAP